MGQFWTDKVNQLISAGHSVTHRYKPSESIIKLLSNKAVYIKADMDTDADGSPRATTIDPDGQMGTSLRKGNGWKGDSNFVNAETIPFYVLPLNFNSVSGIVCKLGDSALVRFNNKEIFAIFADEGPRRLIGEGSIKLVESLGENPWNHQKTKIISGIGFGVEYLVFPHSSETFGIPATFDEIQEIGQKAFQILFGE